MTVSASSLAHHETGAMAGTMEGLGGETGNLPLHQPRGGPALRVWRGVAGEIPRVPADAGERLPVAGCWRRC